LPSDSLKQFQNQLTITSLKIFLKLIQLLPRRCSQALFSGLFRIAYLYIHNLKNICRANLQFVYGQQKTADEYEIMVRACFDNIGRSMMDMLYFVERPKQLLKIVRIHHEERLKKTLEAQCGVIAVSAHLGNFPLLFLSLVRRGYRVNVVIRSMREKGFSKFMYDLCALWNINMIETFPQKHFIKETFSALRRNELLFILLDEVVPADEGVTVPFLGSYVTRGTGPMLFHDRLGAPVLPMFMIQDQEGAFDLFIEEPLSVQSTLSPEENTIKNITYLTGVIESFVQKYPTQWGGWLNKRWISSRAPAVNPLDGTNPSA
jgi:KDO2-lipid IV(A) lauroyltransferase